MIVTLTGTNSFLLQQALHELVAAFLAEHDEMGLERLDGEEAGFDRMREALQSLPFLASKKMVLLRAPSANKQFVESAEELLGELPETTDVVLVEPKLDKRSAYYKYLKKTTGLREYNELDANGLAGWLSREAQARDGHLSPADARFLVERAGANQQNLANELNKLLLYQPEVSRATIELLTEPTPQSTIFELLDAAFSGNRRRTMELYDEQRKLKVEPQQIIAMLAWQLHVLALLKAAGDRTPDQVASEAKLSPFVIRKSLAVARKLSLPNLKALITELLQLDIRLKTESLDADEALRTYLLAFV